jgi:hypothetical protein
MRRFRLKAKHFIGMHPKVLTEEVLSNYEYIGVKPKQSDVPDIVLGLGLKGNSLLWMEPSLASELIDCEYFVKVTLSFDNFCGCGTYAVMLPQEICNGMVVINTRFSAPPKINIAWNPMMLSPVPDQNHNNITQDINIADHNSTREPRQSDSKVVPKAV